MLKKLNLVQKKIQFTANKNQNLWQKNKKKKKKKSAQKTRNNAKNFQISAEKIQKIFNRVDWILSKRVFDVITVFIASAKILECEGSISPSTFYGKLPDC